MKTTLVVCVLFLASGLRRCSGPESDHQSGNRRARSRPLALNHRRCSRPRRRRRSKPPAPPQQPPAPPVQTQTQAQPQPQMQQPEGAVQPGAGGQWVYTEQYGWIWMPYGNQYTYEGTAYDTTPYSYVYLSKLRFGRGWRRHGFGAGVRIPTSDS